MNHRNFTDRETKEIIFLTLGTGLHVAIGIFILGLGIINQDKDGANWFMLRGSIAFGFAVSLALRTITIVIKAAARLVAEAVDGNEPEPKLILPGDRAWPS